MREQPPHMALILTGLLRDTMQLVYLMHQPHLALTAVRVVLQRPDVWQDSGPIQASLAGSLAGLSRYAPREVEQLLTDCHAPASLRYLAQGRQATDDQWRQVLLPRLSLFLGDVLPRPGVIDVWVKLLRAIPASATAARWLKLMLRESINLIYGQPLMCLWAVKLR